MEFGKSVWAEAAAGEVEQGVARPHLPQRTAQLPRREEAVKQAVERQAVAVAGAGKLGQR